jgi:hypothetical protein
MIRQPIVHAATAVALALVLASCGKEAPPPPKQQAGAPKAPEALVVKIGSASPAHRRTSASTSGTARSWRSTTPMLPRSRSAASR